MATRYFVGRAASVAQVTKIVYSSIVSGETYSATINGKTVSYTATSTSLGDLIDALVSAWNASAEPEHQEFVAARREDPTLSGLQLTCRVSGVPQTITAAATTGSATVTDPTAASGPNFWNVAANWDGGTLPSATDALIVEDSDIDILYGLTDSNAYASLTINASYTGAIGLAETNPNGYPENRTRYLTLSSGSAIAVNIGYGDGQQAERVLLSLGGSNTTLTVYGSTSNTSQGFPISILNTGASSTAKIYGGSVEFDSTSTATVTTLEIVERAGTQSRPNVRAASAVTVTTATCFGGRLLLEGSNTTLIARDSAEVTTAKAASSATVKASNRARVNWGSSGGITTKLHVEQLGVVDFGLAATTKTVAACDVYASATLLDPLGKVTWTAGVTLIACRIGDVEIDLGVGYVL